MLGGLGMKLADAFSKTNGKWITELSTLQCHQGKICLQSGKVYANVDAFIKDCISHYSKDEDRELTHWTFAGGKVVIFND
jgi:hypothetical protein